MVGFQHRLGTSGFFIHVHQGENISLGASAKEEGNPVPVSSRKFPIGQILSYMPFFNQSSELGEWGLANQGPPSCLRWGLLPRKVVTV